MLLRTVSSVLVKVGLLVELPSDEFIEGVSVEMYEPAPGRSLWHTTSLLLCTVVTRGAMLLLRCHSLCHRFALADSDHDSRVVLSEFQTWVTKNAR
jgi:hypothetical protein